MYIYIYIYNVFSVFILFFPIEMVEYIDLGWLLKRHGKADAFEPE